MNFGAFLDCQKSVFVNSLHRLCAYHKIHCNFLEDKECKSAVAQNDKVESRAAELQMPVRWLNMFTRDHHTAFLQFLLDEGPGIQRLNKVGFHLDRLRIILQGQVLIALGIVR